MFRKCLDCELINSEVKIVRGVVKAPRGFITIFEDGVKFNIPVCCSLCENFYKKVRKNE